MKFRSIAKVLFSKNLQLFSLALLAEANASHDREPNKAVGCRGKKHRNNDLAERSVLGDSSNEYADETGPSDPYFHKDSKRKKKQKIK